MNYRLKKYERKGDFPASHWKRLGEKPDGDCVCPAHHQPWEADEIGCQRLPHQHRQQMVL